MSASSTARMPAVFFGHGNPMITLSHNRYTDAWRQFGAVAPAPKAILTVSAHWLTRGTAVTAMPQPRTIHDFGGFPQALYDIRYPAPGDPALAARIRELLHPVPVELDEDWGLDHGTWTVLAHAYPGADVPVLQLSLDGSRSPRHHYELAQRLAPLREEGVLVVGSGNVVHNLMLMRREFGEAGFDWAVRFNDAVRHALHRRDHGSLIDFDRMGGDARRSIPTPEHFLPLLYIAALQCADEHMDFIVDGYEAGSLSMLSCATGLQSNPEAG